MEREVIAKKRRILSRISYKQYRELLAFVEEFYLADYSLKILVARKGSNLFCALIDLVREEDGGRVRHLFAKKFPEGKEPVIISDRALDYYAKDIKNGKYPTILIADDTIRHGKTIFELCDQVEALLSGNTDNSKVDVRAFAASEEDMADKTRIKKDSIKNYVNLGEYRVISDMVIDILYLAGQPYTSYIPNIVLKKESLLYEPIKNNLDILPVCFSNKEKQKELKFRSNIWIAPHTPKFAMFQSMRFYMNDDLEQCTIVPMVSLMPISDESLLQYGEILKDLILADYYNKVFFDCRELSYRAIIYVVSSLFLRLYFRQKLGYMGTLHDLENPLEEKMNFGGEILNQEKLNQMSTQEIMDVLEKMEEGYQSVSLSEIRQLDADIEELDIEVNNLMSKDPFQQTTTDTLVQKFFSVSGDRNEKKWKENWKENFKRKKIALEFPCGYPFICLSDQLKAGNGNKSEIYSQVLKEIDYGSGSIVDREKKKNEKTYYLSFLNAGERNYKYKEKRYFPVLYGLFEIEQRAQVKGEAPEPYKTSFVQQFMKQGKVDDYDRMELEKLCSTNITLQYKPVLLKDVWLYPNKDDLDKAIILADKIIQ